MGDSRHEKQTPIEVLSPADLLDLALQLEKLERLLSSAKKPFVITLSPEKIASADGIVSNYAGGTQCSGNRLEALVWVLEEMAREPK